VCKGILRGFMVGKNKLFTLWGTWVWRTFSGGPHPRLHLHQIYQAVRVKSSIPVAPSSLGNGSRHGRLCWFLSNIFY
jgi:hypothetical protein